MVGASSGAPIHFQGQSMKHRRLKSVPLRTKPELTAVHDRRATQLPAGALIGIVTVDCPFERGARITAVASLRDDPLGALWARHQIDDAKYHAGRHWQRCYETVEGLRGQDLLRTPVDGSGNGVELFSDERRAAVLKLAQCTLQLGRDGDQLVRDILGKGMFLIEAAAARGYATRRGLEYLGVRFRECLECLAKEFGYVG